MHISTLVVGLASLTSAVPLAQAPAPASGDAAASAGLDVGGGKISLSFPQVSAMLSALLGGKVQIAGAGDADAGGGLQIGTSGAAQGITQGGAQGSAQGGTNAPGSPPTKRTERKRQDNPLSGLMGGDSEGGSPFEGMGGGGDMMSDSDDDSSHMGGGGGGGGGGNPFSDLMGGGSGGGNPFSGLMREGGGDGNEDEEDCGPSSDSASGQED